MVQGYYTLQEAAQVLGMPPDELKRMAQKNEIRSFQDRGTWRFRVQDIQELARRRGLGSEMDMVVPEVRAPRPSDSPAPKKNVLGGPKSAPPKSAPPKSSPPRSPSKKVGPASPPQVKAPDVFNFSLDPSEEAVDLNLDSGGESPSAVARRSGSKSGPRVAPKSGPKSGPRSPVLPPGSDSDVRLVSDGSDLTFSLMEDSGPKMAGPDSDVKMVHDPGPSSSMLRGQRQSGSGGPATPRKQAKDPLDSGVRLVPMDSDSDVKIVGAGSDEIVLGEQPPKSATDSDIRLQQGDFNVPSASNEGMLTEEINLDEELRKQEALQARGKPAPKVKPKSKIQPALPKDSPFELSEQDLDLSPLEPAPKKAGEDSSDFDLTPAKAQEDSSDFDLTPLKDGGSSPLAMDSDEITLAPDAGEEDLKGPSSGISLENPADSGISLEPEQGGGEDIEFELSLDAGATPRPRAEQEEVTGSSEFELSLDVDDAGSDTGDSSEFELTLDDNAGLADDEAPQVKAEDKDIFETDFEAAAAEDESASEVAALDTDLDSSEFDLDLADSEIEVEEEESGSQVVALDEEEVEAGAETVAGKRKPKPAAALEEEPAFDDLGEEAEVEEEMAGVGGREVIREKFLQPAPWGALPVVFMLPCVVVMIVVGIMGFELVTSMTGYRPPGFLTKSIAQVLNVKL